MYEDNYEDYNDELENNTEWKEQVVQFIQDWDTEDTRDPYYVASVLYSVEESDAQKWVEEAKQEENINPFSGKAFPKSSPEVEDNLKSITNSLEIIKNSMKKLEQHNLVLIDKWKKKLQEGNQSEELS